MVTLLIAAELFSQKVNLEVQFPSIPSLPELTRTTESLFNVEVSYMRPEGHPAHPFRVSKFKLYDDVTLRWLDLVSELQLSHNAQLYAFQMDNPYHRESQRELPNPTKPRAYLNPGLGGTGIGSVPLGGSSASPASASLGSVPLGNYGASTTTLGPSRAGLLSTGADPTHGEKLRVVFDDIDSNKDNVINMDEMRQSFATLGLQFSAATVSDLFLKGDENRDGIITFNEFERFAQRYPIMLDCLYYHSRMFWDSPQLREDLARAKEAGERARRAAEEARLGHQEMQRSLEERASRLEQMERELAELSRRLADDQKLLENATRDRDALQRDRADKERDAHMLQEQHRALSAAHQTLRRELEKINAKLQGQQLDTRRAEERVQQLQQQLADAQRALDRARAAQMDADKETATLREREQRTSEQFSEVTRQLADAENLFKRCDEGLRAAADRERDIDNKLRALQRHFEELKHQREGESRAVDALKSQVRQREQQHNDALHVLDDNERRAREAEQELLELQRSKQRATDSERTLVEQEVRLREQRECLEMKESALMREANVVVAQMKDHSQARGSPARVSRKSF